LNIATLYKTYLHHPSVNTDTRLLQPGDLFFALKGPRFDGNAYAGKAIGQGASYAIIDDEKYKIHDRMILVDDALVTLQQLARYHRDQFQIPFIAITGSNGKTTTKELIKAVLSTTYKTYATEGNLNNHIGVPLTILRIKQDIKMAVIEMGANHQHEIESYCKMVNPTHGIITNIGKAHLEGFGGIEGVRKGKGELFDYLRHNGGTAFICKDFDYFDEMSRGIPEVIWYGTGKDNYVHGNVTGIDPFVNVETDYTGNISTRLIGDYNVYNILASVAAGKYFKVPSEAVQQAIAMYSPSNARSQMVKQGENSFILDAYNANPSSMRAAIENLAASSTSGKKVLMLGAMMELGEESRAEHQKLVDLIGQYPWESVVLVGGDFAFVDHPYIYLPDSAAAKQWLEKQHYSNATILIKGSRKTEMEKVLS
jgi:UDP-N-acetylmuramoyl-tripeptide--D-alanyl-D-alanine ligase